MLRKKKKLCECGCGLTVGSYARYRSGHSKQNYQKLLKKAGHKRGHS